MSSKSHYIVSIFNHPFESLEDAKWNVKVGLTREEAKRYLCHAHEYEHIYHFIGDRIVSQTPINVDKSGNITFGRTRKVM